MQRSQSVLKRGDSIRKSLSGRAGIPAAINENIPRILSSFFFFLPLQHCLSSNHYTVQAEEKEDLRETTYLFFILRQM